MAKKGGVQLLQAEINSDEEFEKFLERPGLLVMDIYTEWCGPCLGMVGSLKKIKLELGGDNLQLAICKSDSIDALKRFRDKSEPTWLFASHGKSVNLMFGTNVPKLMSLIVAELEIELAYRDGKAERIFYEITEPLPLEIDRMNVIRAAEEEAARIDKEENERKRREYILHVTNEIIANMPDMGITIFGPHVNRDIFKKFIDPADSLSLSCKDRKVIQVIPENLEVLHFDCENPINDEAWNHMFNKEMLICLWKTADNEVRSVEEVLGNFVELLSQPQPIMDEFGNPNPELSLPPIVQADEITLKYEVSEPENLMEEKKNEGKSTAKKDDTLTKIVADKDMSTIGDEAAHEEETKYNAVKSQAPDQPEIQPQSSKPSVTIKIPAIWTPKNRTTNAAAIYLFFRQQTEFFLPPDPVPEPSHLAIAFDAYKRKDINEICEQYKDALLAYGYFTTPDPENTELIANSTKKYELMSHNATDKLVLKVAKVTSHALLALSAQGPCYVSQNIVTGKTECLKFFPEGYKTGEAEEEELSKVVETVEKKKKKRKSKKSEDIIDGVGTVVSEAEIDADAHDLDAEEDGNETPGEEIKDEGEGAIES